MKRRILFAIALAFFMMLLTACSLAPAYHRPLMNIPAAYKEKSNWTPAKPQQTETNRGPWWEIFGDSELNALEERVSCTNQNLQAAFARYERAQAAVAIARSDYFPTIKGYANVSRQQTSGNIANKNDVPIYSDYIIGANLAYEVDLFGRIRNNVLASQYLAKASAADLAALDLSMHAELAADYFALRGADSSQRLLDTIVIAYRRALTLIRHRHEGGTVPQADVDQAQTQLENAKTIAADLHLKRAQFEHAIAILIGEAPAFFTLKAAPLKKRFVAISPRLPSTLLERRPDIAAAERRVQAANAEIGIARAAFFPSINLVANAGFESDTLSKLIEMPSLIWALGPTVSSAILEPLASTTLFDGGRLRGLLNSAQANYYESVANYRETVLSAFREVEDSLAAQRQLEEEYDTQTQAAAAAERALAQARYRYRGGIATYLDVVVSENIALQSELASINIQTRRQTTTVQLIKALGGCWKVM